MIYGGNGLSATSLRTYCVWVFLNTIIWLSIFTHNQVFKIKNNKKIRGIFLVKDWW